MKHLKHLQDLVLIDLTIKPKKENNILQDLIQKEKIKNNQKRIRKYKVKENLFLKINYQENKYQNQH